MSELHPPATPPPPRPLVTPAIAEQGPTLWKRNAFLVLLLIMATAGLYLPIWFLRRRPALNRLGGSLRIYPFVIVLILLVIAAYFDLTAEMDPNAPLFATPSNPFVQAMNLAAGLIVLFQCFGVKSILEGAIDARAGAEDGATPTTKLSGLLTFFAGIIYLQHVINREATLGARTPAVVNRLLVWGTPFAAMFVLLTFGVVSEIARQMDMTAFEPTGLPTREEAIEGCLTDAFHAHGVPVGRVEIHSEVAPTENPYMTRRFTPEMVEEWRALEQHGVVRLIDSAAHAGGADHHRVVHVELTDRGIELRATQYSSVDYAHFVAATCDVLEIGTAESLAVEGDPSEYHRLAGRFHLEPTVFGREALDLESTARRFRAIVGNTPGVASYRCEAIDWGPDQTEEWATEFVPAFP